MGDNYLDSHYIDYYQGMKHKYALKRLVSVLRKDEPLEIHRRLFWNRLGRRAVDEGLITDKSARNYVALIMKVNQS